MDTTINPGDDFFVFANGGWIKNNPIPDDKNLISTIDELSEKSRKEIMEIINVAAAIKDAPAGIPAEKLGKFYRAGMDTIKIESQGITPIKMFFDKIDEIGDIEDVQTTAAFFQSYQISTFFILFSSQDKKNSNNVIAQCEQAGIRLPDRDFYLNSDEYTKNIREKYLIHITRMFGLLKDEPALAEKNAETIMKIETMLAKAIIQQTQNKDTMALQLKINELIAANREFK